MYHLASPTSWDEPLCGHREPGDFVVPRTEAENPDGRHFNCPECDRVLHSGLRHAEPPEGTL
jgi:transposase